MNALNTNRTQSLINSSTASSYQTCVQLPLNDVNRLLNQSDLILNTSVP